MLSNGADQVHVPGADTLVSGERPDTRVHLIPGTGHVAASKVPQVLPSSTIWPGGVCAIIGGSISRVSWPWRSDPAEPVSPPAPRQHTGGPRPASTGSSQPQAPRLPGPACLAIVVTAHGPYDHHDNVPDNIRLMRGPRLYTNHDAGDSDLGPVCAHEPAGTGTAVRRAARGGCRRAR